MKEDEEREEAGAVATISRAKLKSILDNLIKSVKVTSPNDSFDIGWDEGALTVIYIIANHLDIKLED